MRTLFVTGAGFSVNAGLPLASQFGEELLNIRGLRLDGPSAILANFLRHFVSDVFGQDQNARAETWPPLEDIFTFVDLSANTGHHLGVSWSAARLRTVRRALIARSMRMLQYAFNRRLRAPNAEFRRFGRFIEAVPVEDSAFLSMNWDTVLEQRFRTLREIEMIDYGSGALPAVLRGGRGGALEEVEGSGPTLRLFKPHGSFNWTYCDTCRNTFWVPAHQVPRIANQIFSQQDWQLVGELTGRVLPYETSSTACPRCGASALGTRLATFSYRKALDFPMYASSWRSAEAALASADNWVFIGYSLPAADYEFKLLLKRVQLARTRAPQMFLVTMGDDATRNYRSLFGRDTFPPAQVETTGLSDSAIEMLQRNNVLD